MRLSLSLSLQPLSSTSLSLSTERDQQLFSLNALSLSTSLSSLSVETNLAYLAYNTGKIRVNAGCASETMEVQNKLHLS